MQVTVRRSLSQAPEPPVRPNATGDRITHLTCYPTLMLSPSYRCQAMPALAALDDDEGGDELRFCSMECRWSFRLRCAIHRAHISTATTYPVCCPRRDEAKLRHQIRIAKHRSAEARKAGQTQTYMQDPRDTDQPGGASLGLPSPRAPESPAKARSPEPPTVSWSQSPPGTLPAP